MASTAPGPGVALQHGARAVHLKWHMLRRRPEDPGHQRANLRTGLARGATLEVDLQFTADGEGVCLHDETLEAETTGRGPVRGLATREVRGLRQRGAGGEPLAEPPLFLEEVAASVRDAASARGAVQLDLKAPPEAFDAKALDRFAAVVRDVAACFTLSGEEWPLVQRAGRAAPGARLGFEPLRLFERRPPRSAAEVRDLVARILAAAPEAEIVYLHAGLALRALEMGEDPVARLVDAGRIVDCWTVDPHRTAVAESLARLIGSGCEQVTTNGPEALERLWSERDVRFGSATGPVP